MIPCAACATSKKRFAFSASSVLNFFTHKQTVVCSSCAQLGCSGKCTRWYTCAGPCQQQLGKLRFDAARVAAHDAAGKRLCCKACHAVERSRETSLNRKIKGSEKVCKCEPKALWTPRHKEKCFLYMAHITGNYMWMDKLAGDGGRTDAEWLLRRKRDVK